MHTTYVSTEHLYTDSAVNLSDSYSQLSAQVIVVSKICPWLKLTGGGERGKE